MGREKREGRKVLRWIGVIVLGDFLFSYNFIPATCVKKETFFYSASVHDARLVVKNLFEK